VKHVCNYRHRRSDRFLGRWEQSQFLALVGNCDPILLQEAANRVPGLVPASGIRWWGDELHVNVAVRVTMAERDDTPDSLMARFADH
jgi:hypothetical protein